MSKIEAALNTVSATANSSSVKENLQNLLETLTETSTVDDYPVVQWPNIPDRSATVNIKMKLRTCQEKKRELSMIEENCLKNQSKIAANRKAIEGVKGSAIDEVRGAILGVEDNLRNYSLQLNVSIQEIDKMYNECLDIAAGKTTTKKFEIIPEEFTIGSTKSKTTSLSRTLISRTTESINSSVTSSSLPGFSISKTFNLDSINSSLTSAVEPTESE